MIHIDISLAEKEDYDGGYDAFMHAYEEYKEAFPNYDPKNFPENREKPSTLPEYVYGCHIVRHGICFMVDTEAIYNHFLENIFSEAFFQSFALKYPHYYFRLLRIS